MTLSNPAPHSASDAEDKLDRLFSLQTELNDRIFAKKDLRDREGRVLTMQHLRDEARQGDLGPNGVVNEWLGKYLTALDDEGRELREELLWKWWSKDKLDLQNIRVEIVDQLHFWISLALTSGMGADDVMNAYLQKNAINHQRQDQGYSKTSKNESDNRAIEV